MKARRKDVPPDVCSPPPDRPVRWLIEHRDGTIRIERSQTAFGAATAAKWLFADVRSMIRIGDEDYERPIGPEPLRVDPEEPAESSERASNGWHEEDLDVETWQSLASEDWGGPVS